MIKLQITSPSPNNTTALRAFAPSREPDPEITRLRAHIADLETKLALYRRRERLELEFARKMDTDNLRAAVAAILQAVSATYSIPLNIILSRNRTRDVAEARQVAMNLIREQSDLTLKDIGRIFNRDHGTILHAFEVVRDLHDTDPAFAARIQRIRSSLQCQMKNAQCSMLNAQ